MHLSLPPNNRPRLDLSYFNNPQIKEFRLLNQNNGTNYVKGCVRIFLILFEL